MQAQSKLLHDPEWRRVVVHPRYVPNLSAHAALYDCVPTRGRVGFA